MDSLTLWQEVKQAKAEHLRNQEEESLRRRTVRISKQQALLDRTKVKSKNDGVEEERLKRDGKMKEIMEQIKLMMPTINAAVAEVRAAPCIINKIIGDARSTMHQAVHHELGTVKAQFAQDITTSQAEISATKANATEQVTNAAKGFTEVINSSASIFSEQMKQLSTQIDTAVENVFTKTRSIVAGEIETKMKAFDENLKVRKQRIINRNDSWKSAAKQAADANAKEMKAFEREVKGARKD